MYCYRALHNISVRGLIFLPIRNEHCTYIRSSYISPFLSRNYRLIVKKYPMPYSVLPISLLLRTPYSALRICRGKRRKKKKKENKCQHPTPTLGLFELTQLSPSFLILFYIVVRFRFQIAARPPCPHHHHHGTGNLPCLFNGFVHEMDRYYRELVQSTE